MERKIITTKDGSSSVFIPELNVTYHSLHGAIQESMHVFIDAGLNRLHIIPEPTSVINIFELGFGTGLNVLLTLIESEKLNRSIYYSSVELFPLDHKEMIALNYCSQLRRFDLQPKFEQLHLCDWEKDIAITPAFSFHKSNTDLLQFSGRQIFDLIYFDAFAPMVQPELWTTEVFQKLYSKISPGGILVTYCSKVDVQKAMKAAGFIIEKIPGPHGKRDMLKATRL